MILCAGAFSLPAHADKAVKDASLIQILEELKTNQKEEFGKNVDRWEEVSELLKKYIAYSKAEEVRHGQWQQNNTLLDKAKKDDFANTFKGLAGGMREVKGTDLSSKALASGLSSAGSGSAGAGASVAGFSLASLADIKKLVDGFTNGSTEDLMGMLKSGTFLGKDTEALEKIMALHTTKDIDGLMASVGALNASRPNADVLTKGMKEVLQRTKLRTDTAGQDLASVKSTGTGSSSRLTAIEALVQQASSLGAVDPKTGKPRFDGAKLAELRTYMSSLSAMQNEELIKLNAKEMGDRASDKLLAAAGDASVLQSNIERAKGK